MANGKKKKSKKKLFIFGGLGLVVVILIVIAFVGSGRNEIIAVQTEKVQKRDITQTVAATGKINPEFQVIITPEVTGEIVSLPVKDGDRVKKGDLLIKIKGDVYVAQRERAEANLESTKSLLSMRKADLQKVTQDYNRIKELYQKKLSSESELETINSSLLSSKAAVTGAEANVQQMQASLKEINEQIAKTTIYSPMDGTVTALNVELGERILGSGFSQGTNLMTVSDLRNMEATVEVDENDVVLVTLGDTAKVKVDAFSDKEFTGVVTEIGNSAQTAGVGTQEQVVNFNVKIKILNPDQGLRPGMSCNADIQTETVADVFSVPIQSVTARGGNVGIVPEGEQEEQGNNQNKEKKTSDKPKEVVFIIDKNKSVMKEVKTGLSDDNYIEIKEGLKGGEQVVSGSYRAISKDLADGTSVRVEDKKRQVAENK